MYINSQALRQMHIMISNPVNDNKHHIVTLPLLPECGLQGSMLAKITLKNPSVLGASA